MQQPYAPHIEMEALVAAGMDGTSLYPRQEPKNRINRLPKP